MTDREPPGNWSAATWEGATREAMRRWAELPLEKIIAAQEEMAELAEALGRDSMSSVDSRVADSGGYYQSSEK